MRKRVLNVPNVLTLMRICVVPLLALLIARGHGISACLVLILAGITDILDGWIARKYQLETAVGKLLDPVADKIFLCVAVVFLVARPELPLGPVLATLILAREFLITGLRAMMAAEGIVMPAGQTGKIKTVTQMVGLGALMLMIDPFGLPSRLIGLTSLWISVVLSYASMLEYIMAAYRELKARMQI